MIGKDELSDLMQLEYEQGADPALLAAEYGVSEISVRNLMHRRHAEQKPEGGYHLPEEVASQGEMRHRREMQAVNAASRRIRRFPIEVIAKKYHDGTSIRQLAKDFGMSRHDVTVQLRRYGIKSFRRRRASNKMVITPDKSKAIIERYEAGASLMAVADDFDMAKETVRQHLVSNGVKRRPPSLKTAAVKNGTVAVNPENAV